MVFDLWRRSQKIVFYIIIKQFGEKIANYMSVFDMYDII